MDRKDTIRIIGFTLFLIGIILGIIITLTLAATDLEYAKHDDSLYATWQFLTHGGWLVILLGVGGVFMMFRFE